jgi:hypothetical protein
MRGTQWVAIVSVLAIWCITVTSVVTADGGTTNREAGLLLAEFVAAMAAIVVTAIAVRNR